MGGSEKSLFSVFCFFCLYIYILILLFYFYFVVIFDSNDIWYVCFFVRDCFVSNDL